MTTSPPAPPSRDTGRHRRLRAPRRLASAPAWFARRIAQCRARELFAPVPARPAAEIRRAARNRRSAGFGGRWER